MSRQKGCAGELGALARAPIGIPGICHFAIGKPFVRSPRGDSRATPEEKLRAKAQRAAEAAERRAEFLTNLTAHQPQNYS